MAGALVLVVALRDSRSLGLALAQVLRIVEALRFAVAFLVLQLDLRSMQWVILMLEVSSDRYSYAVFAGAPQGFHVL